MKPGMRHLVVVGWAASLLFAAAAAAPWTVAQEPTTTVAVYLPQALAGLALPFATPVAAPTSTATPTATPTVRVRPTSKPSPTATLAGPPLDLPSENGTIVLQIGWTQTNTVGQVWQEMEGTPWLTLYNDGRLIAGHAVLDRAQPLYEGRLTPYEVQALMRRLVYQVGFFQLAAAYDHPSTTKPSLHVYARTATVAYRVTIRGWLAWTENRPPDVPGASDCLRLAKFVQDQETANTGALATPYLGDHYTILAQELRPSMVPAAPQWTLAGIDVAAIADAAPLIKPSPIDRFVGHLFVNGARGREALAVVSPVALGFFPFEYVAAEFRASGRPIAVGVRQEVPGGSLFLDEDTREHLYRADKGSGVPPLSASRPAVFETNAVTRCVR